MKILYIFILLLLFTVGSAYQMPGNNTIEVLEFNDFINQLKTNKYRPSKGLPEFEAIHIGQLLVIANNDTIINNFPRNPISSYFQMQENIKAVSLWLIEGIRKNHGRDSVDYSINWYPSLNPVLINVNAEIPQYENSPENLEIAYQAYITWWEKLKNQDTARVMQLNPLEGTGLRWH